MNKNHAAKMIQLYFAQGDHYYSDSKAEMLKIAEMHPAHAANAAALLLENAKSWANDAAVAGTPARFVLASALFEALQARATAQLLAKRWHCTDCGFVTLWDSLARDHSQHGHDVVFS